MLAKKLQAALDLNSASFATTTVLDLTIKGLADPNYAANCGRNVYKHSTEGTTKDIKSVADAAAKNWYSGNTVYNYQSGDTNDEKKLTEYQNFARMIWKSAHKVAFGMVDVKGADTIWVVGYYCFDKPAVGDGGASRAIADVKKNVGRYCIVDGYNDCYNQRGVLRHNERREAHAGYVPLVLDKEIAKAIQK